MCCKDKSNKKCCGTPNSCCKADGLRYQGPPIPEFGIATGDLIEAVIGQLATYLAGGVATSSMVNNEDGTYTHAPGDGTGVSTTFIVNRHTTGAAPHSTPQYNDTWYDTNLGRLKMYINDGIDVWREI